MGSRFWRVGAAGVLVTTLMVAVLGQTPAAAEGPERVWQAPGEQYVPRTDGEWIVWLDGGTGIEYGGRYEVLAARMDDGEEFVIAPGFERRAYADVSAGVAVWAEHNYVDDSSRFDVVAMDLETGETFTVAGSELDETHPAISGGHVVWIQRDGDIETMMARNIETLADAFVVSEAGAGWRMDLPRMENDRIIWGEADYAGSNTSDYRLVTATLGSGEVQVVNDGTLIGRGLTDDYDISGDRVVYAVNRDLRYVNLTTGETRQLSTTGACPSIEGDYIFWEDFRNYDDGNRTIELWGYDMRTGSLFQAAAGPGSHEYPHMGGDLIVWQATPDNDRDVFAAPLTNVLPTSPVPHESTPEGADYFVETNHTLGGEFQAFWKGSGGVPVFGFSLTEEFSEWNNDTGELYTVQYFERQRFEHHPELAGTPYEVLIGRLGVEAAQRRGLLETDPFQPLASNPFGDECLFFSETGHSLCRRFLTYWQSHGLEMGDEGVSFRESVALFGYPLSEEFTDPETGYVSQYFERAIFEYHPEHDGTEFEVLLVRLGAQEIAERGW